MNRKFILPFGLFFGFSDCGPSAAAMVAMEDDIYFALRDGDQTGAADLSEQYKTAPEKFALLVPLEIEDPVKRLFERPQFNNFRVRKCTFGMSFRTLAKFKDLIKETNKITVTLLFSEEHSYSEQKIAIYFRDPNTKAKKRAERIFAFLTILDFFHDKRDNPSLSIDCILTKKGLQYERKGENLRIRYPKDFIVLIERLRDNGSGDLLFRVDILQTINGAEHQILTFCTEFRILQYILLFAEELYSLARLDNQDPHLTNYAHETFESMS